ncbi:MAG: hypothetical protein LBN03_02000 [Bifidobacteriaceae bacterium]|nr:hypothetical protein [Bifidobacteriaceae bacterium]
MANKPKKIGTAAKVVGGIILICIIPSVVGTILGIILTALISLSPFIVLYAIYKRKNDKKEKSTDQKQTKETVNNDKPKIDANDGKLKNTFFTFSEFRNTKYKELNVDEIKANYAILLDVCDNPGIEDKTTLIEFDNKIKDINILIDKYEQIFENPETFKTPEKQLNSIKATLNTFAKTVLNTAQDLNNATLVDLEVSQRMLGEKNDLADDLLSDEIEELGATAS